MYVNQLPDVVWTLLATDDTYCALASHHQKLCVLMVIALL